MLLSVDGGVVVDVACVGRKWPDRMWAYRHTQNSRFAAKFMFIINGERSSVIDHPCAQPAARKRPIKVSGTPLRVQGSVQKSILC